MNSERLMQEIVERTRAEEALRKDHSLLVTLSQQVPGVLFQTIISQDGHISTPYSSEKLHDIYEVSPDDIRNNIDAISERFHPDDRQRIFDSISQSTSNMTRWECEYRVNLPRQGLRWLFGTAQPQRMDDGSIALYGIIMDITERKFIEESLKNSEEQFIEAFNKSPLLMAISTLEDGCYIEVNNLFLETLGLNRDEVIGVNSKELNILADYGQRARVLEIVRQRGYVVNYELSVRKSDGEFLDGLFSAQIISLQQKRCLLTTFQDISDRKRSEVALKNSEERYRRLFEMESDSVVMVDDETGKFIDVNSAAVRMYGYSRDEFLQLKHVDLSAEPLKTIEFIRSKGTADSLRWHKNKGGTVFPVEIAGSYFEYQGREVHVAAIRDVSERVRAEKLLLELNNNLRALSEHSQKVQENERLAIARDIHDDLGQNLTVLKLDLEWIENRIPVNSSEITERILEMRDSIEKLTVSVQQIAGNLRPPLLDNMGLVAAIEWQVDEFRKRNNIECYLLINEEVDRINQDFATPVMRIIQEAFTNVIRHARATEVSLSLCITHGILIIEISDDGCGITAEQANSQFSYGLMGMRERVRICKGDLVVQDTQGRGTSLYVTIPLYNEERTA